jgi:lipopolysaccharide/colanic/teichoic acid biosynthesis glycosyltransferase
MLKFRTMVPDAEKLQEKLAAMNEMDGPVFKITNDPRLIRGGSFLRRHSLDELPQLWNVLRGDMSVVGPRPLSRRDYDLLKDDWQRKRFSMRPGLTCSWQVHGNRNDLTFLQWMQLDLDYIDRWCLGLDFRLIFSTIKTVVVGGGK